MNSLREQTVKEQMQAQAPPKKGGCGRCCLMSCLGLIAISVVGVVAGVVLVPRYIRSLRENVFATAPAELPKVTATDQEIDAIKARAERFAKTLDDPNQSGTLVLTADDINKMIARDPDWQKSPVTPYFEIKDGRVIGHFVIPIDKVATSEDDRKVVEFLGVEGRYINATAVVRLSLRDGRLDVYLDEMKASGKALPRLLASWLRKQNLGQKMLDENAEMRESIRKLESIEVKDDQIIIKSRQGGQDEPARPAPPVTPEPRNPRREGDSEDW